MAHMLEKWTNGPFYTASQFWQNKICILQRQIPYGVGPLRITVFEKIILCHLGQF